jgi:hypothetical protein
VRQFHAARFAAPSGMNLGFDHHHIRLQPLRRFPSFLFRKRHFTTRRRHSKSREDSFGLILVNLHCASISARILLLSEHRSLLGNREVEQGSGYLAQNLKTEASIKEYL